MKLVSLPKEGTIVATITYTLEANCEQSGPLEIKTAETTGAITLTINGGGHTISVGKNKRMNFLIVDDEGHRTFFNKDTTASPNVKVIIKNVTFDGNNRAFASHHYYGVRKDGTPERQITGIGSGISAEGTLELENVTFTKGNGTWVRAEGTASLKNILFEDSYLPNAGFGSTNKGILHVTKSGNVTLNNAVFRNSWPVVFAIEIGGSLSTTGCLSFIRILSHKGHHSGVSSAYGTWNDSSKPAPCTGKIGNKGQAVVAYTPPTLPCGLPYWRLHRGDRCLQPQPTLRLRERREGSCGGAHHHQCQWQSHRGLLEWVAAVSHWQCSLDH